MIGKFASFLIDSSWQNLIQDFWPRVSDRRLRLLRCALCRECWHLIPEPGPDQAVVVRFQPMVAENVAEVTWHKTQRVVRNDDGTIDFHATVSGLGEISWWVLSYGDQAEVLQPPALREIVRRRCQGALDRYADSQPAIA